MEHFTDSEQLTSPAAGQIRLAKARQRWEQSATWIARRVAQTDTPLSWLRVMSLIMTGGNGCRESPTRFSRLISCLYCADELMGGIDPVGGSQREDATRIQVTQTHGSSVSCMRLSAAALNILLIISCGRNMSSTV
eukprot:6209570-Pleurochrysis_carterae.AAC.3